LFLKTDGAGNLSFSSSLPASSVGITQLSATGSPSSSTFLRGDNSWASAGATAGQVIQVIQATDSTERTTTSTSYVTASNTLSVTITPSSASNKIYIMVHSTIKNTVAGGSIEVTLYRGATNIAPSTGYFSGQFSNTAYMNMPMAFNYLDSPSSTSSLTYQVYWKVTGSTTGYLNTSWNANALTASITAFEIKG